MIDNQIMFNEFIIEYKKIDKEYKEKLSKMQWLLLVIISLMMGISALFLLDIKNEVVHFIISVILTVVSIILYIIISKRNYDISSVNENSLNKMKELRKILNSFSIDYKNEGDMHELIDFCTDIRDKCDIYRTFKEDAKYIGSAILFPTVLATISAVIKTVSNAYDILVLSLSIMIITIALIFIIYQIGYLIEELTNKTKKLYDALVLDLKLVYIQRNLEIE